MNLAQVANELYAVALGEFVSARGARAKQVADRLVAAQVRKLPKPSAAAYVVNQLVRHHHDDIEQLIELGDELRQAQSSLDGAEMRKLDRERRQLTRAVAKQGIQLAEESGTTVSAPAATQVEETLHAAMADTDAAEAVRTGRLSRALSASGFGPVDVDDAVAVPDAMASVTSLSSRRRSKDRAPSKRDVTAARDKIATAERETAAATAVTEQARESLDVVSSNRDELKEEIRRLRDALRDAEQRLIKVEDETKAAERTLGRAGSEEEDKLSARDEAKAELDRLTT